MTPITMATVTQMTKAVVIRTSVAGMRSPIMSSTGRPV